MSSKKTILSTASEHWYTDGYKPENDFVLEFGLEHKIEPTWEGVTVTIQAGTALHDELKKKFPGLV